MSPNHLFGEAMLAVLSPTSRSLGPVFLDQLQGAVMGAPLPLGASLVIAWPQTVALIVRTIVLFVGGPKAARPSHLSGTVGGLYLASATRTFTCNLPALMRVASTPLQTSDGLCREDKAAQLLPCFVSEMDTSFCSRG